MSHLILVGLPGAGKTTVGRAVAARLKRTFIDFDEEIELRQRMSVSDIFQTLGEARFREMERSLTEELRAAAPMVVAPGGGWIARTPNVELVRPPARLVYLRLTPERAIERLGPAIATRPLLAGKDSIVRLRALLADREAAYSAADFVVDVEPLSLQQVIDAVCRLENG